MVDIKEAIKELKKRLAELENASPKDAETLEEMAACQKKIAEAESKLFKIAVAACCTRIL